MITDDESGAQRKGESKGIILTILVAALGYFVDIYDLVLFSIVRKQSLLSLGVPEAQLLDVGVHLINMQMGGMLIGGILWGMIGDKRGRLSVLFGSILMYSLANIANGLVQSVEAYAWLRFIAGIGLAGELGAGITLVSEAMGKRSRGYGTTIVATVGICGAVVAAMVGDLTDWRTAYFIGGGLGVALLLLRIGVYESGMFNRTKERGVSRGNLLALFYPWARARRYAATVLVGVPIWYAVGILVTFSPEIGGALGLSPAPQGGRAIMFTYIGLAVGDLASGALSQVLRSRRKAVGIFLGLTLAALVAYLTVGRLSLTAFYGVCVFLGFGTGYWAVFVTVAAEQFGTNIRATAATTAPNFVRGAVVLLTMLFQALKAHLGIVGSATAVGALTMSAAAVALWSLHETYGRDIDFVEE